MPLEFGDSCLDGYQFQAQLVNHVFETIHSVLPSTGLLHERGRTPPDGIIVRRESGKRVGKSYRMLQSLIYHPPGTAVKKQKGKFNRKTAEHFRSSCYASLIGQ